MAKPVNFAVIGCGFIGKLHGDIIAGLPGAHVAAVVDCNEEEGKAAAQRYGCRFYKDLGPVLEDPSIQAVTICLPPGLHCETTVACAKAGKAVLCEKPLEIDMDRARTMVEVCGQEKVPFGVIMQHRFVEPIIRIREAIAEGAFGKLLWGTSRTIWYRDKQYYSNPWRGTWKYEGGGALINQSIHYIDLLTGIMGDVKSVSGKCRTLLHKQIETEDIGIANVEFANGALGTIEGTTVSYPGLYAELCIFGEKGTAIVRNDYLSFYRFADGPRPEFDALLNPEKANELNLSPALDGVSHTRQIQDFVAAVQEGRDPAVTGVQVLKSLELIKTIYRASQEKREIYLPDD